MRNLTQADIDVMFLDGEIEDCEAVEATVQELADLGVGTICGHIGNQTFKVLADKGYGHRKCRGWFQAKEKVVVGRFHIKIQTDKTAEKVSRIAAAADGSLRYDGNSSWEGFKAFEIE